MTIAVKRSDLAWMLGAVIPHVHRVSTWNTAAVGLEERGEYLMAYAMDGYTVAVARAALVRSVSGDPFACRIPSRPSIGASSEAGDLMRYVRPGKVEERDQAVELVTSYGELHAAVPGSDGQVFNQHPNGPVLEHALTLIQTFTEMDPDQMDMLYNPAIFGKFSSAQRMERDRLTLYPKRSLINGRVGIMVVTIGSDFVGAISGMSNDHGDKGTDVLASFLQTEPIAA